MKKVRLFSFGGGMQSVAVASLQVLGRLAEPYEYFIHANVGDDSENPDTIQYLRSVFKPWASANNINLLEVSRKGKTLLQYTLSAENKTVPLPIYLQSGAPGNRTCTRDWKVVPINNWIKENGYTHAEIGIGFSMDEMERCKPERQVWHNREISYRGGARKTKPRSLGFWRKDEYPLVDLKLFRHNLPSIFDEVGLPVPPKSACWFCPFSSKSRWIELKRRRPDLFISSVELEKAVNHKRSLYGLDRAFLHSSKTPLEHAVSDQIPLWDFETGGGCESGICFT